MFTLEKIIQLLITYKYYLLFPISVIEGPIISIIGGFLISGGILDPIITYLVLISGDIVGDTMYYSIGRWGGNPFIRRFGHYIKIDENKLIRAEKHFKNHGGKTLLFGKTQAFGALILLAAGVIKMPYWKFIGYNTMGTILKTLILIIIGYYFGEAYSLINQYLGLTAGILSLLFIIAAIIYILIYTSRKTASTSL